MNKLCVTLIFIFMSGFLAQDIQGIHDIMQDQCPKQNCQCVIAFLEIADRNQEAQQKIIDGTQKLMI